MTHSLRAALGALAIAVALSGCSVGGSDAGGDSGAAESAAESGSRRSALDTNTRAVQPARDTPALGLHIIQTASLTVWTRDVGGAVDQARSAVSGTCATRTARPRMCPSRSSTWTLGSSRRSGPSIASVACWASPTTWAM